MIFIKARWVGMKYNKIQLCSCKKFLKMSFFVQQHPAGDLSLLARAATEPQAQLEGGPAAGGVFALYMYLYLHLYLYLYVYLYLYLQQVVE